MSNSECPICMDAIDASKNTVITECGHAFHCSCLMQNAAHNGFGCPYCRTTMAAEPVIEDDDDDDDEEDEIYSQVNQVNQEVSDDVLTSFRMFTQRLDGEEVEEEPEEDWETDDEDDEDERPNAAYMAAKMIERGITYEDLVKNILNGEHGNYGRYYRDYDRRAQEVYGQFRAVISRYTPDQNVPAVSTPVSNPARIQQEIGRLVIHLPEDVVPEVAETKNVRVHRQRDFMIDI